MPEQPKNNTPNQQPLEWLLAVILLFAVWPVGLFLLIRLLSKGTIGSTRTTTTTRRPIAPPGPIDVTAREIKNQPTQRPAAQAQAAPSQPRQAARPQPAQPSKPPVAEPAKTAKKPAGKKVKSPGILLMVLGTLVGVFGAAALLIAATDLITLGLSQWRLMATELGYGLGGLCTGLVLLRFGLSRRKRARRFRRYLALIGTRSIVPIDSLAKAMPVTFKRACDDLQEMLDEGILPYGYLDLSAGRLVLSETGLVEETKAAPPPRPKTEGGILQQIRTINDAIDDEAMSRKIDRIQEITAKILAFQKQNPDRGGELRSFLDYYLPTTLKLMRAYAQLEAQGIEGENIRQSKAGIESAMDKVVAGFEARLDKLFQSDALDISSDIAVLEQMLRKDGLSQEDELTIKLEL